MAHNAPDGRMAAEKQGHERFDLDVSYLGWFSVGLVVLLIVTAWIAFFMLGGWRISDVVLAQQSSAGSLSGPFATLQNTPQDDLRSYRLGKAAALEGYHWVDRRGGIVRIPIERAMQLVAADAAAVQSSPQVTPAAQGLRAGAHPSQPAAPAARSGTP